MYVSQSLSPQSLHRLSFPYHYTLLFVLSLHLTIPHHPHPLAKPHKPQLSPTQAPILLAAKTEVEKSFESDKWALINKKMEQLGADTYPTAFLQKKWKELDAQKDLVAAENEDVEMGDEKEDGELEASA